MSAAAAEMLRRSLYVTENELVLANGRAKVAFRDAVAAKQAQTVLWLRVRQLEADVEKLRCQNEQLRQDLDQLLELL